MTLRNAIIRLLLIDELKFSINQPPCTAYFVRLYLLIFLKIKQLSLFYFYIYI